MHGVFAQYKSGFSKEWIYKTELLRTGSITRQPYGDVKSLESLRQLLTPRGGPTASNTSPRGQPESAPAAPHQVHHYHFGWQPPQLERAVGTDAAQQGLHYGDSLNYAKDVHTKSSKILSRQKLG